MYTLLQTIENSTGVHLGRDNLSTHLATVVRECFSHVESRDF